MNGNEFDKIVNKVLDNTKSVLSSKASEYASSSNRMHNFAKCSKFNSLLCMGRNNNARALWALLAKHVASISDIVDDTTKDITMELLDEKFGDTINYLILLKGIIIEDKDIAESDIIVNTNTLDEYQPMDTSKHS